MKKILMLSLLSLLINTQVNHAEFRLGFDLSTAELTGKGPSNTLETSHTVFSITGAKKFSLLENIFLTPGLFYGVSNETGFANISGDALFKTSNQYGLDLKIGFMINENISISAGPHYTVYNFDTANDGAKSEGVLGGSIGLGYEEKDFLNNLDCFGEISYRFIEKSGIYNDGTNEYSFGNALALSAGIKF